MEDCPKPIQSKDIRNKEKKFEIKTNNNKLFNICFLNQGNSLLINAFYNDQFTKFSFEKNFNLSEIQNVKLFTLYSSIDECLDEIFQGINSGKCNIIEESNFIILIVPLSNKKYNEIKFQIDEKEKNDKEKYEELYKFSINLKNENSFYKNEINELKEKIKNMESLFENLNGKVQDLEKNLETLNKKKNNQNWIESNIITNLNDKIQLKNWISLGKNINSKLLFRLSIHGETIQKFHELCDKLNNNLVIVQTQDNNIFGAYCTWCWDISGNDLYDSNGFLFSLNNKQKYLNENRWIHQGCKNHGPYIYNNFYFEYTMKKCVIESNDFFNKTGTYDVKEVEIYEIIFDD